MEKNEVLEERIILCLRGSFHKHTYNIKLCHDTNNMLKTTPFISL